ncbi:MAG: MATE family efflux transporter [Nitriliruptorales bacterium]|nr:MATE family efflux transporter [Nitriliruptorales bacterium]
MLATATAQVALPAKAGLAPRSIRKMGSKLSADTPMREMPQIFLAYGTTASVARLLGAGDRRAAAHDGVQGLWLALAIGIALIVVVVPLAPQLIAVMGGEGAVAENGLIYLRISMFGVPVLLVMQAGAGYLRGLIRTTSLRLSLTLGTAIAARLGVVELGAYQIAFELWSFTALALDSIAITGQAITGRLLGAGDAEGARAAGRRMMAWGVAAGTVFAAVIALFRPVLPALFTSDQQVIVMCTLLLWFVAALQPVNAIVFVLDGILIGTGDMRYLAWAMAAAAVFAPAAILVVVLDLGIGWLWTAIGVLMFARMAALLARFAGSAWQVTGATR